jgi:hypothetical protein
MNGNHMLSMEREQLNSTSVGMPTELTAGRDRLCWHRVACIQLTADCITFVLHHFTAERVILFYKLSKWLPRIVRVLNWLPWKRQDRTELRMTRQLTACRILEATADCTVAKKRQ